MAIWCIAYDTYKCEHISGLQKEITASILSWRPGKEKRLSFLCHAKKTQQRHTHLGELRRGIHRVGKMNKETCHHKALHS